MTIAPNVLPWMGSQSAGVPELVIGTLLHGSEPEKDAAPSYLVTLGASVQRCTLAVSCLVKPQTGDRVLVCRQGPEGSLLAILERPQGQERVLSFPGDLRLEVPRGEASLACAGDLRLTSARSLKLTAAELALTANETSLASAAVTLVANQVKASARVLSLFGDRVETVAQTLLQRLTRSIRLVEETDTLSAGELLHTVKRTLSLRARHALISAENDVKIDGERIHMG